MRIAVFGAGGVGGYFGGRLAQAGEEVAFIARGEHLRALQAQGLRVDSALGDFTIQPVQATDDPATVGVVDVVLLGVKAWQVEAAAQAMRPMIGPGTFVVPLQNGVEAPTQLVETLGAEHVVGGLCRLISYVAGPGHIRHEGGGTIQFGELDNQVSGRVERLYRAFGQAEGIVKVEIPADIHAALWNKFLLIVAMSGVGAVTRAPVGVLLSLPETRQLLQGVMQEVYDLAHAYRINLAADIVPATMRELEGFGPQSTASMQRDIMDGRPSELETQTGAVVRMGQQVSLETPLNNTIYSSLLPLELRARGKLQFDT